MAESKTKSRTFRGIKKKTPGNRLATYYVKRSIKKPVCGVCGSFLQGMQHGSQDKLNKLSKTQRRPERAFGGVLCSKCSRERIKATARGLK
jgi:large subunit ribosomal protein L34e